VISKQAIEVEWPRIHGETSVRHPRPLLRRSIPIELDAILVGIPQIQGLADAVIRRAVQHDTRGGDAAKSVGKLGPGRIEDREMVQARASGRRRRAPTTLPGVQPDMVMITAGSHERRSWTEPLRELKAEHVAIEAERAIQVRYPEMNMPDADLWMNGHLTQRMLASARVDGYAPS